MRSFPPLFVAISDHCIANSIDLMKTNFLVKFAETEFSYQIYASLGFINGGRQFFGSDFCNLLLSQHLQKC